MLGNEDHCWECKKCSGFWRTNISIDEDCKYCPFCGSENIEDLGIL